MTYAEFQPAPLKYPRKDGVLKISLQTRYRILDSPLLQSARTLSKFNPLDIIRAKVGTEIHVTLGAITRGLTKSQAELVRRKLVDLAETGKAERLSQKSFQVRYRLLAPI
jgi:hypothetical protein